MRSANQNVYIGKNGKKKAMHSMCLCMSVHCVAVVIQFGCVALRQACSPFSLSFFLESSIWSSFYIFVRILEPACYTNALLFACWRGKMPFIRKMLSAVVILFFFFSCRFSCCLLLCNNQLVTVLCGLAKTVGNLLCTDCTVYLWLILLFIRLFHV